jgi:hypothetical protein
MRASKLFFHQLMEEEHTESDYGSEYEIPLIYLIPAAAERSSLFAAVEFG